MTLLPLLLVASQALAQDYVRTGELAATLDRTDAIFRTVLKLPPAKPPPAPKDGIASRVEIVEGFWRLYSLAKPKFVFSLRPVQFDAKRISPEFKGPVRERLITLVAGGFVAPYGPLTTGHRSGLTPEEYGDALGQFIARTMERTHTPSRQFSPYLQGGG